MTGDWSHVSQSLRTHMTSHWPLIHFRSCIANISIDVLDQTWRGEVWSRKCVLLLELGIGSHLSNPITGAWWHLTPHTRSTAALQHCRHGWCTSADQSAPGQGYPGTPGIWPPDLNIFLTSNMSMFQKKMSTHYLKLMIFKSKQEQFP